MRGRRRAGLPGRADPTATLAAPRNRTVITLPTMTTAGGTNLNDTTYAMPGRGSSRRVFFGASGTFASAVANLPGAPLNLSGKNLVFWFRIADPFGKSVSISRIGIDLFDGTSGAGFNVAPNIGDGYMSNYDVWMPVEVAANGMNNPFGAVNTFNLPTFGTGGLTLDWTQIRTIRFRVEAVNKSPGSTASAEAWFGGFDIIDRPREPVFTFVFDRFNRDVIDRAFPMMSAMGWAGSSRGNVGQLEYPSSAFMTLAEAQTMYAAGWDIGIYDYPVSGFTDGANNFGNGVDLPFTAKSKAAVISDLRLAQQRLVETGMPRGADQMAGQARKLWTDGFTDVVQPLFNYANVPNANEFMSWWPPVDPLNIPNKMYIRTSDDSDGNHTRMFETIDRMVAQKEWGQILFHSIDDVPYDGFCLTTAKFQSILDKVASTGCKVRTVSQVMHGQV